MTRRAARSRGSAAARRRPATRRAATRRAAALLAAALAGGACTGQVGTITIDVVTAPGSTLLDDVVRVRAVLSRPYTVVEAERGPGGGFDLALDVLAEGPSGEVLILGYDAAGDVIAYGRTPLLPIAAIDAGIAVYLAPPLSIAEAPVSLGVARTDLGVANLEYGVLLAGGADATGAPTRDLVVYSAYDHELQRGEDLPEARAGLAVGSGATGYAYLFGGVDADGEARGTVWRFDTTVAPGGAWLAGDEEPDLARAGVGIAPLGSDAFLVLGAPPVLLEGLLLRATAFDLPPAIGGIAASVQREDDPGAPVYTVIVGADAASTGVLVLAGGSFLVEEDVPDDADRTGHAAFPTVDDEVLVLGGQDDTGLLRSALRCDPALGGCEGVPDVLATPRVDAAIAATASYVVVAGGRDAAGELVTDAEIFTLEDLTPVATVPLVVPRAGAIARPLPNQQILIVGGVDAEGAPIDTIELFTPAPPELP